MNNEQHFTKITNKDLEQLIVCSINTKESTFLPTAYERSWLEALKYKELEIEGYVREDHFRDATKMAGGWTKFDSGNPKTFPEHGSLVLMCRKDGVVCFGHFFDGDEKRSYWGHEVTHWKPLPEPPVEMEGE